MAIVGIEYVDLLAMVEADGVHLRGSERGTMAGACPKCGGTDRFGVLQASRRGKPLFYCRNCHPKMGDAMDYVRIVRGLSGREAFELLRRFGLPDDGRAFRLSTDHPRMDGMKTPATPPTSETGIILPDALPAPASAEWRVAAAEQVVAAHARLRSPGGKVGLDYLHGRGITDATITAHGLGFLPPSETRAMGWRAAEHGAIAIPWYFDGDFWKLSYRAVGEVPKQHRYRQMAGSGVHALPPFNGDAITDSTRVVLIVEGEFDALIGQQCAGDGVAVVTWGSKSTGPNVWAALTVEDVPTRLVCLDADVSDTDRARWSAIATHITLPAGSKDLNDFGRSGGDVGAWLRMVCGDDADAWDAAVMDVLAKYGYAVEQQGERFTARLVPEVVM